MSLGTGFPPSLLDPRVCQFVVKRPEGRPDLHCVRSAGHTELPIFDVNKPHMVAPEFDLDTESDDSRTET